MKIKYEIKKARAFTLVEVIVVISIIGLLTTISIVYYSNWSKASSANTVKNDLTNIVSSMEGARTFGNGYPKDLPASFEASPDVSVSGGGSGDGKSYCVSAVSNKNPSIRYYVTSSGGINGITAGSCTPMAPVGLTAVTSSASAIAVSWSALAGATSYTLQRSTSASFSSPVNSTQAGTSFNSTGLNSSTTYYYRVRGLVDGQDSAWSSTVNAETDVYVAPMAPVGLTAVTSSDSAIAVSWSALAGATSYTLHRSTSPAFTSPTIRTQAGTSFNSTGLNSSTTYYYRVRGLVDGQDSAWSSTVNAETDATTPPIIPPVEPPVIPPSSPLTIAIESEPYGVNMRLTATIAPYTTCPAGTPQYSLRTKTGIAAWSSYTAWSSTVRSIATGWVGKEVNTTYYFEAISQCYVTNKNITNIITTSASHTVGGSGPVDI